MNGSADTAADTNNKCAATATYNHEADKGNGQDKQQTAADGFIDEESALGNGVVNRYIHTRGRKRYYMLTFFNNIIACQTFCSLVFVD